MIDNSKIDCNWYVFYEGDDPLQPEMVRIASDCLGNALTTAQEWASRCNRQLIGVAPDKGVKEERRNKNESR